MLLSDDKQSTNVAYNLTIEHFEKMLMELLQRYAKCQKKITQLTEENTTLKSLLKNSILNFSGSTEVDKTLKKVLQSDHSSALIRQINAYIKEIDICLSYFEKI